MLRASDLRADPLEMEALKLKQPAIEVKRKKRRVRFSKRNTNIETVKHRSSLDCIEEEKKGVSESEEL